MRIGSCGLLVIRIYTGVTGVCHSTWIIRLGYMEVDKCVLTRFWAGLCFDGIYCFPVELCGIHRDIRLLTCVVNNCIAVTS